MNLRALLACLFFSLNFAVAAEPSGPSDASSESFPLGNQLQVLARDLASSDYQDVLASMIRTDLAAEWQRVATPDNYVS